MSVPIFLFFMERKILGELLERFLPSRNPEGERNAGNYLRHLSAGLNHEAGGTRKQQTRERTLEVFLRSP